jgi:hypothetical protein
MATVGEVMMVVSSEVAEWLWGVVASIRKWELVLTLLAAERGVVPKDRFPLVSKEFRLVLNELRLV